VKLETERLVLRDFLMEDAAGLAACRRDERFWRYYEPEDDVAENAREHVSMFIAWQSDQPRLFYQLAVVRKATQRLIGSCGIRQRPQVSYGDSSAAEADIGYEIDASLWRQGYATEAVKAILEFGFGELKLHRVWSFCLAENEASWRVMERAGLRWEGLLRDNVWLRGRWWDTVVYAILAQEWEAHGQK
jgi:ribosomal-protein-alanine N-acetyltransferase